MRYIRPIVLFLDDDLETSAKYLTNFHLEYGIKAACQVLMCSLYYLLGYRTKFLFKHYFCKERWDSTRLENFPNYPLSTIPKYTFYNSEEARWCRRCQEHYNLMLKYFGFMLTEYTFRTNRIHQLADMYGFFGTFPMETALRKGYTFPHLKNKSKLQLPWKNLPVEFRRIDIVKGYRLYYRSLIPAPLVAFVGTKRDVPEFLCDKINDIIS